MQKDNRIIQNERTNFDVAYEREEAHSQFLTRNIITFFSPISSYGLACCNWHWWRFFWEFCATLNFVNQSKTIDIDFLNELILW